MRKFFGFLAMLLCVNCFAQVDSTPNSKELVFKVLPSQPKFYVTIHGGYALALGSTFKFYNDDVSSIVVRKTNAQPQTKSTDYETTRKGLGEGARIGAGISYVVNDFINVGLDVDYFKSTIYKNRDSSYLSTNSAASGSTPDMVSYNERQTTSYKTTLLTFMPNVTFKAISRPNFFIYNKIGAVFTFRPNSLQKERTTGKQTMGWQGFTRDSSFSSQTNYSWGIQNPSFGFMGGIGIQVRLLDRLRGLAEIQFSHIVFRTKSRTLTSMIVDGKEMANQLSVSQREIEFEREYVDINNSSSNPNEPTKAVVQRFPISYVGLQIGLAYRF